MERDQMLIYPLESAGRSSLTVWERIWRLAPSLVTSVKVVLIFRRQNIFQWTNISQPQSVSGPMAATQMCFILLALTAKCTRQTNWSISAPDTAASPVCNVYAEQGFVRFSGVIVHFPSSRYPSIPKPSQKYSRIGQVQGNFDKPGT